MSILLYIDSEKGKVKPISFEVATYARALAAQENSEVVAVAINVEQPEVLGTYGVQKILNVTDERLVAFSAKAVAHLLKQAAEQEGATTIVLSASSEAKNIAPLLAVALQAGYVPNVLGLPEADGIMKSNAFSSKAIGLSRINTSVRVLGIAHNAFGVKENAVNAQVVSFAPVFSGKEFDLKSEGIQKATDKVSLDDATIIVSGGRGLKGAENWGIVEELADVLGAATACSKPVADMGWRPHSEHVGQTGKPVAPNLYIAIGISGAIQHLAGVNASKVKLVINTDPEAPFFKAADYGVVGDAFKIVPQLIEKLKK